MSKGDVKNQVKARIEQEKLDDQQYQSLQAMIRRHQPAQPDQSTAPRVSRRSFLAGMATAAGMAGLGLGAWQLGRQQDLTPEKLTAEVLRNHQWLKPMDLSTARFDQLASYFAEGLDFGLTESRIFPHERMVLEGGRYCSLGGIKAAQIVFRTDDGQLVTFYQTRYDPDLIGPMPIVDQNQAPLRVTRDQHRISLWVENGLLMASAESLNG